MSYYSEVCSLNTARDYLIYWIKERISIKEKRVLGLPKPWSDDPIFQQYKFCHVLREDDRVTKWLFENWYTPNRGQHNLWFAACVARLFNWPDTLARIGFPNKPFKDIVNYWRADLKWLRDHEEVKVFTGAYLVSTNGVKMDKIDYILDRVLTPIAQNGHPPFPADTLESYWRFLTEFDGLGSFMAGQVIADLKFCDPVLEEASDWQDWAPLGPGSKRGLNRVFERPLEKGVTQQQANKEFIELRDYVRDVSGIHLSVHNLQNCLCETDKYLRLKNNEGSVRSKYNGVT
jgi:hypothetical protein